MAKRRLNKRQKERIEAIKERRLRQAEAREERTARSVLDGAEPDGALRDGLVITNFGANQWVEDLGAPLLDPPVRQCVCRQNLGDVVCGDRVLWQPVGAEQGVISAVKPRSTTLARLNASGDTRALAANIDRMFIICAPIPRFVEELVDRYLAAAELLGIPAVVVINKADLIEGAEHEDIRERAAQFARIGYPVLFVSGHRGTGMKEFLDLLPGHTSILVGQSGVGKSSLINAMHPELDLRVQAVSELTGLGSHTTTTTTLYHLPDGGALIDSPGVRAFGLWEMQPRELERGFREFLPLAGHCRFNDCSHTVEPGCALREATERGDIAPRRLKSFLALRNAAGD